jgi:hypothetical protein
MGLTINIWQGTSAAVGKTAYSKNSASEYARGHGSGRLIVMAYFEESNDQIPVKNNQIDIEALDNNEGFSQADLLLDIIYSLKEARLDASAINDSMLVYFLDMTILHARNTFNRH